MSLQAEAKVLYGLTLHEFWSLTPPEFFAMRKVYRESLKQRLQILDTFQANVSFWTLKVAAPKSSKTRNDFLVLK